MERIIVSSISLVIAIALAIYTSFAARCKGPILTNTFIWGSSEDRRTANIKHEYRQAAVVFGCLASIFALLALHIFTAWKWPYILMWIVVSFTIMYAIVSSTKK